MILLIWAFSTSSVYDLQFWGSIGVRILVTTLIMCAMMLQLPQRNKKDGSDEFERLLKYANYGAAKLKSDNDLKELLT